MLTKKYYICTNKNKQQLKLNKMTNYRFIDPTEFAPQVMRYILNNEVAEIEIFNKPLVHAEIIKKNGKLNLVINGKIVKQAVKFSTIEKYINNIK